MSLPLVTLNTAKKLCKVTMFRGEGVLQAQLDLGIASRLDFYYDFYVTQSPWRNDPDKSCQVCGIWYSRNSV